MSFSQGPNSPGTAANVARGGSSVTWGVVNDSLTQNDQWAQTSDMTVPGQYSDYLQNTNFSFSNIPARAVIRGVLVEYDKWENGTGASDDSVVSLVVGGSVTGTNKATGTNWATSDTDTYTSYGGSGDTWGLDLTVAQVQASNFGVAISVRCESANGNGLVDHVRITIYYDVPDTGGVF